MNSSQLCPPDERIAEVARWQGGHVARRQLLRLGLDDSAVAYRVRVGRLIRVHQGVYAVGHIPTNPLDRAHGALLAAGARTGLAGATALALWRNERTWPERIELISPRDIRLTGVTVHRSSSLRARDIRSAQGLRLTSPARTALDMAARVSRQALSMNELERLVDDLRHRNRLKVDQLTDVVERNWRHPGAKPLRALIGYSQREHSRSELERAFRRLLKRHGLPRPLINVRVGGERVDAYFPDHQLIVELDGREVTHADDWRPAFEGDRARMVNVMLRTGIPTIRFTWDQITRLDDQTADKLRGILEARAGLNILEARAGLGGEARASLGAEADDKRRQGARHP
ncbi:MAG: type IV toxin-antitoxin system AbiEi family antitoxin domain-containing protein [Acidobacteriota bacterium]|nr:type IV toxin-antitoxin system AbiEi family antitoxin domain-containing protein [Acidobacteriota bacterium]